VVPEKLEVRISEKKFLSAVELLAESLKRIREPYMMEIGALSDLRTYLGIQETVANHQNFSRLLSDRLAVSRSYPNRRITQPPLSEITLLQRPMEGTGGESKRRYGGSDQRHRPLTDHPSTRFFSRR
jgi:hypothetical protein